MKRRTVLLGAGCLAVWPVSARAQRPSMPVLGYLSRQSEAAGKSTPVFKGFHRGLAEIGFVEGRNLAIEYRWADWQPDRLPGLAADLVNRQVTAIFAVGGPEPVLAAKAATAIIPIIFHNGSDPVRIGLIASLNRPGGNVTGMTLLGAELGPKRLELLRDLVPESGAIAMLVNPNDADSKAELERVQRSAKTLGQELQAVSATTGNDFENAFREAVRRHCVALMVSSGALFGNNPRPLAALAERYALPTIFDRREAAETGGLMSYGTDFGAVGRRDGLLVGRVLKGEKPADLPAQQPTKFELVVNLKTAKALGLAVPQSLLARADEVIE